MPIDKLIDCSHPKAANFAVLLFLIFSMLMLTLGILGFMGVLSLRSAPSNFAQGILLLSGLLVLAARLRYCHLFATAIGVAIVKVIVILGGLIVTSGLSLQEEEAPNGLQEEDS